MLVNKRFLLFILFALFLGFSGCKNHDNDDKSDKAAEITSSQDQVPSDDRNQSAL